MATESKEGAVIKLGSKRAESAAGKTVTKATDSPIVTADGCWWGVTSAGQLLVCGTPDRQNLGVTRLQYGKDHRLYMLQRTSWKRRAGLLDPFLASSKPV